MSQLEYVKFAVAQRAHIFFDPSFNIQFKHQNIYTKSIINAKDFFSSVWLVFMLNELIVASSGNANNLEKQIFRTD